MARAENQAAIDARVTAWSQSLGCAAIESVLQEAKVPAARIYTMEDIFADPHYRARDMLVDVHDDVLGPVTVPGIVPKLSRTPGRIRWAGRDIGADTADVMQRELELSMNQVEQLAREGVIAGPRLSEREDEQ